VGAARAASADATCDRLRAEARAEAALLYAPRIEGEAARAPVAVTAGAADIGDRPPGSPGDRAVAGRHAARARRRACRASRSARGRSWPRGSSACWRSARAPASARRSTTSSRTSRSARRRSRRSSPSRGPASPPAARPRSTSTSCAQRQRTLVPGAPPSSQHQPGAPRRRARRTRRRHAGVADRARRRPTAAPWPPSIAAAPSTRALGAWHARGPGRRRRRRATSTGSSSPSSATRSADPGSAPPSAAWSRARARELDADVRSPVARLARLRRGPRRQRDDTRRRAGRRRRRARRADGPRGQPGRPRRRRRARVARAPPAHALRARGAPRRARGARTPTPHTLGRCPMTQALRVVTEADEAAALLERARALPDVDPRREVTDEVIPIPAPEAAPWRRRGAAACSRCRCWSPRSAGSAGSVARCTS
jgi:hypothetical protein